MGDSYSQNTRYVAISCTDVAILSLVQIAK
jgi:hypothetical protein